MDLGLACRSSLPLNQSHEEYLPSPGLKEAGVEMFSSPLCQAPPKTRKKGKKGRKMCFSYLAKENDVAVHKSHLWMLSNVDSSPIALHLTLVFRVEVNVEALFQDTVNVGSIRAMEEQNFLHSLLYVHLAGLLERLLLGVVVLQCLGVADVFNRLD